MNKTKVPEIPLFDLYDLWYEPLWHKSWFWWLICLFVFSVIVLGVFWFIRKRRAHKHGIEKTPWQIALERLEYIKLEDYNDPASHKLFYSELTAILKRYLTGRYDVHLESKTDEEVIIVVRESEFPKELLDRLSSIFHGALYIKFAHQDAAYQQMQHDLERSIDIITTTATEQKSSQKASLLDTSGTL